jgi:hypothetical protein
VSTVSALSQTLSRFTLLRRGPSSSHSPRSADVRAAGASDGRWKVTTVEWLPAALISSWSESVDHHGGSGGTALPPRTTVETTVPLASVVALTTRGDSKTVLRTVPLATGAVAQRRGAPSLTDATAARSAGAPFHTRAGAEGPTGVGGPSSAGSSGASQSQGFADFPTAMLPTALGLGRWLRPTPDLMPRRQHVPAIEVPG